MEFRSLWEVIVTFVLIGVIEIFESNRFQAEILWSEELIGKLGSALCHTWKLICICIRLELLVKILVSINSLKELLFKLLQGVNLFYL